MLNNVNDTLDYAQIKRGTFQAKPANFDISTTINEVVQVVEMQAASQKTEIKMNLPKNKMIFADK